MLNGACSRVLDPVWNLLPEVEADYYFVASGPLFLTSMTGFTRRRYRVIQNSECVHLCRGLQSSRDRDSVVIISMVALGFSVSVGV